MDKSRQVYGIDLGTTYSCIAQVDKFDQAVVLRNFEGDATTPSAVYFEDQEHVVVGKEAKGMLISEPSNTVCFVKREIGVDNSYKKPTQFPYGLDPTEISAYILRKLVKDANDASDCAEPIKDVVITCPAYFGTKERMQTKQAGIIAGLNVLAIINEPTAAAISYGVKVDSEKMILVYDLGGGTFDITLIRVNGGVIKVIATGGDHHLGGVDWDMTLSEYMLGVYNQEHGTNYDIETNPELKYTLLLEAEQKKKILTAKSKVNANISFNGVSSRIEISRELFDQLTEGKLDETISATKKVLEVAKSKGFEHVDEVLLVGGSARMPQIKERVDKELSCDSRLTDPDECVAKGAAVYAMNQAYIQAVKDYEEGEIEEKPGKIEKRTNIINVTSKTYGTDISGNQVQNLIFANTGLPCRALSTFYTIQDNQKSVSMKIFESDFIESDENNVVEDKYARLIHDEALVLTGKWPKSSEITVTFDLDNEGMLSVHAEVEHDKLDFTLRIEGVKTDKELVASIEKMNTTNVE